MSASIPVLMYHSVAPEIAGWAFKYLSLDPAVFEDHVASMAKAGYTSVFLDTLRDYVAGRGNLSPRTVVLTFDDGYLDNWVYVFPVLKKYGFKATVFVSSDFIDPRDELRANLEDVWAGRCAPADLKPGGFLTVAEMKAMLASGLVDIQGHCRTHTWYFTGQAIMDFHRPGDGYPWLAWNARPDRKYLYLEEDQSECVPFGSPVYAHEKSLLARRYFADPAVSEATVGYVAANGGAAFFGRQRWREDLVGVAEAASAKAGPGRWESDAERLARLEDEIQSSKRELERLLAKPVDALCWPGGAYDQTAVEIAARAGYRSWTLASSLASTRSNVPGEDPRWIRRLPAAPWWIFKGKKRARVDGKFLVLMLREYQGLPLSRLRLRAYKLGKLIGNRAP